MGIREMEIKDYQNVYALWMACAGMGLNDYDDSQEGIERFLKRNPETCFVFENQGKIVGVIMCGNDGRRGYIYHTAVHPSYRHQGIGTLLVQKALESLKKNGIGKVALVVFRHNEKGNIFWEKQGFTTREDIVYRNQSLIEMVRYDT